MGVSSTLQRPNIGTTKQKEEYHGNWTIQTREYTEGNIQKGNQMSDSPITTVRRRYAAKIARLTPEQARETLDKIRAEGVTIFQPTIRELTDGFNSQSLNANVIRRLAERAGIVRKGVKVEG